MSNQLKTEARHLTALGYPIVPLKDWGDGEKHPKPIIKWRREGPIWNSKRAVACINRGCTGLAIPTGQTSGIIAVDVDHGTETGIPEIDNAETAKVWSGTSGNYHLLFQAPDYEIASMPKDRLAEGVEVKADGTYVLVPPSVNNFGGEYSYARREPLAPCPQAILDIAHQPQRRQDGPFTALPQVSVTAPVPEKVEDMLEAKRASLLNAQDQQPALYSAADLHGWFIGLGIIDPDEAREDLMERASKMPAQKPGRPWRDEQLKQHIEDGLAHGAGRVDGALEGLSWLIREFNRCCFWEEDVDDEKARRKRVWVFDENGKAKPCYSWDVSTGEGPELDHRLLTREIIEKHDALPQKVTTSDGSEVTLSQFLQRRRKFLRRPQPYECPKDPLGVTISKRKKPEKFRDYPGPRTFQELIEGR